MKIAIKAFFLLTFGFSVGVIFCFASKSIIDYIPKIANILTWNEIDENIEKNSEKTSKKGFFGEIKKEKIGQYVKVLRKKGYKTYYSSFLNHSGKFLKNSSGQDTIVFSNLGNVSMSGSVLDYFIGKDFEDIRKEEREALAFYMGLQKQYSNKKISVKEQFKHYKQKLSLSCEANTLTDFINYYRVKNGVQSVKEYRLIGQIPIDPKTFKVSKGKYYRGDPEVGFVGNMDGYAFRKDLKHNSKRGRGVYPKPLLKILNYYLGKFDLKAIERNKITELEIISSLAAKNPIMMWYIYDKEVIPMDIITSTDRNITLYKNQHVGLIVGTKLDNKMNIKGIYYYDGLHHNKQYMKYSDFKKQSDLMSKFIFVANK